MYLPPDIKLQKRLVLWSGYLAMLVSVIAVLVLLGWAFNIDIFKRPFPHLVAMNPATALSFLFLSGAYFFLTSAGKTRLQLITGYIFASLPLLIGAIKIAGIVFHSDTLVDHILFASKLDTDLFGNAPNRMAPNTAACFVFSGIAFLLLNSETRKHHIPAHFFSLITLLTGLLSVLGYLYGVKAFYGVVTYIPMAIHTAVCFLAVSLAILFARPDKGIMKEITSFSTGSLTARLLVPAAIIIPAVLGLLRLYGDRAGFFSSEFGVAFLVLSIIVVFLGLIWYNAVLLNKRDWQKEQAEQALKESEEQVKTIFNAAPDAVVVINEDGRIIKWNPKAEILFNWTEKEAIGRLLSETIIPQRYREAHTNGMKHFIKTGKSTMLGTTIEMKALRKNNSEFDVSLSVSPTMLQDKHLFIGFIRDITERNELQQQLKKFNEELEGQVNRKTAELTGIFERITEGFIALDKEYRYTYANKKIGEMTGKDPVYLIGKNVWEEFPDAVGSDTYNAFLKAMETQEYVRNVDHYSPLDLWQENHIYPSAEGLSVFIRDISAQQRAKQIVEKEKDFSNSIINSLPGIFYLFNSSGKMLRWNKNFEIVSGYSTDEVKEMAPVDFFTTEQREYITSRIGEVFVKGVSDAEADFFTKDKRKIPYYFTGMLIMIEKEPCLIGAGIDITEKKKAEEKLKSSYDQLRELASYLQNIREEERTKMAREIHDELGQQLTGLKMDISWLSRKINQEDAEVKQKIKSTQELIDETVKTVRRLATELRPSILDDLGLVAAIEWHSSEFEKRFGIPISIHAAINDVELPPGIATGLFRIYQESLTNVLRHADAKHISSLLELKDGVVLLSIKDDGKGFDVNITGGKKTLGLLGMKERTLIMGGTYEIQSKPGEGTRVLVSVPLQKNNTDNNKM